MGAGRKGASLVPRRAEIGRRAGDNPLLLNLQAAGLGLIRMDAGGYITEVNDKILEFTGYASFDLIGCHYTAIVDAASLHFTNLQIGEHGAEMSDGEPYATPLIGKNRDLVWVYGATATLPEGGSLFVCQHFHAIGRKLVDMRGFIHGVRQQFLFAEFDMDGRLIAANSQFCDAFLYPLQEAIGLDHAALVDPAYAATEEYRRFWAALGRGVSHVVQGTRRGRHGHEVGVDAVYFPVPDARGIPGKVVFLARDLTLAYRLEKQRMEEASQSERVDALTGLQNRTSFLQSIQNYFNPMARRRAGSGMVMLISIENFKELGKTYGHEASDAILWVVGNRIRHALRQHDISSRIERNLFGIFVERLPKNKEAIEEFSRKVLLQASGPIEFDGQQIDLAMCAGTVCSRGWQLAKAAGEEAILSCAQAALAAARAKGKGMFRIFDSQLANATARRQTIRRDLEPAIRAGDILLHYQPVVRLSDQMLVGYEALARWNHLALGAVGPDEFIVMAEQNGAIHTLGLYLLEKAVRFAATLPVEQWIAVNVSPIQLQRANFAQQAMEIIRRHGVDPARIDIEITESASLDQAHAVQENIRRLREAGFSISLDDFGTGFSSLAQLLSLRADRIKIDRSFTRECLGSQEKMGIIRSILGLSSAMGMKVVAEGIETPEISSLLMEMGCEYGQGYLFGRPQDLEQNKDVKGGRTMA